MEPSIPRSTTEDFLKLGWPTPGGSRRAIGALAVGFYDPDGNLHYAGQVGTGFTDRELLALHTQLEAKPSGPPAALLVAGDAPDWQIRWVSPRLVAEVSFTAWSCESRARHPVYLGLRDDKAASEVVMAIPDPEAQRRAIHPVGSISSAAPARSRWKGAVPPLRVKKGR